MQVPVQATCRGEPLILAGCHGTRTDDTEPPPRRAATTAAPPPGHACARHGGGSSGALGAPITIAPAGDARHRPHERARAVEHHRAAHAAGSYRAPSRRAARRRPLAAEPPVAAPHSEPEFLSGTSRILPGSRAYRLFLPGTASDAPRPLVVMLHGCRRTPTTSLPAHA
jgi:hypothetical protein